MCASWYFSEEYLRNSTPSRVDGISYEDETKQREIWTTLLQQWGIKLNMYELCNPYFLVYRPQLVTATAMVYFHRFFTLRSLKQHDQFVYVTMLTQTNKRFLGH